MILSPEDNLIEHEKNLSSKVLKAFLSLTAREKFVLYCRVIREPRRTLENIANILNLSRERIRQIEAKGIRKLREPRHKIASRKLDYIELCKVRDVFYKPEWRTKLESEVEDFKEHYCEALNEIIKKESGVPHSQVREGINILPFCRIKVDPKGFTLSYENIKIRIYKQPIDPIKDETYAMFGWTHKYKYKRLK